MESDTTKRPEPTPRDPRAMSLPVAVLSFLAILGSLAAAVWL